MPPMLPGERPVSPFHAHLLLPPSTAHPTHVTTFTTLNNRPQPLMLVLSMSQALAEQVLELLAGSDDVRALENDLVLALGFERFELIKELTKNRLRIVWCTRLSRAQV